MLKHYWPNLDMRQKQTTNIVMITFWTSFASYSLHTVLILFLTRPIVMQGIGYDQAKAYAFVGVSSATGYLMAILGGFMADNVLGIRRSILAGSICVAISYLLVVLSGYTLNAYQDRLFLAAYALIPASSSLLIGTTSGMVSHIYADNAIKAKSAMTFYYMAINVGALLATLIAPELMDSRFGPLSVLALTFVGKSVAALNFAHRYNLYDTVIWGKDRQPLPSSSVYKLIGYFMAVYLFTLFAYSHVMIASIIVAIGCCLGLLWFLHKTLSLHGIPRDKQFVACLLILEAIVFFVIYNQMNSTLILFALKNSTCSLLGFKIEPAQYQMLNPLLIILIGFQLPRLYQKFPKFTIPYQFATGTLLAGLGLLLMAFAASIAQQGLVNGNFIAGTYILITFGELLVSAIGLSMIGLYCDGNMLGFAMGVWYLASSLSNALSGRIAGWVAIPKTMISPLESLPIYQRYYLLLGIITCVLSILMVLIAWYLKKTMQRRGIDLV